MGVQDTLLTSYMQENKVSLLWLEKGHSIISGIILTVERETLHWTSPLSSQAKTSFLPSFNITHTPRFP